jgi:hypothetical protein
MKKFAFLGLMFFIIYSQIFADENVNKFENINFSWQLFYYQENNQKINFINVNPLFFNNNFLLNYHVYVSQNSSSQKSNSQNNRNIKSNSQMEDVLGFLLYTGAATGAVITGRSTMNEQEREIYSDKWKQQEELKNFYKRIY